MANWTGIMTVLTFLETYWIYIVGILTLLLAPGAWSMYTLIIKYNQSGGIRKTNADLAKQNLELAKDSSNFATELQDKIRKQQAEFDGKISAQKIAFERISLEQQITIDKQTITIDKHENKIKELEDEVILVNKKLDAEQIITADQSAEIEALTRIIKRDPKLRERWTDLENSKSPPVVSTSKPKNKRGV
jgi:hypothetical protein